jgi:predicted P-loop ATPase
MSAEEIAFAARQVIERKNQSQMTSKEKDRFLAAVNVLALSNKIQILQDYLRSCKNSWGQWDLVLS